MNTKLIGIITESMNFTINIGQQNRTEMYPVGTLVEIDAHEMESNPDFFHASIIDTNGRIHTYISREQVTAA